MQLTSTKAASSAADKRKRNTMFSNINNSDTNSNNAKYKNLMMGTLSPEASFLRQLHDGKDELIMANN